MKHLLLPTVVWVIALLYPLGARPAAAQAVVSTVSGPGMSGIVDGPAATARFREPHGLAGKATGNLFVADRAARRFNSVSVASTSAGTGVKGSLDGRALSAQFSSPTGLALDVAGNLDVLDRDNPCVRRTDAATSAVSTVAKTGVSGFADGPVLQAQFNAHYGLSISPNGRALYISEASNHHIRRPSFEPLATADGGLKPIVSLFPNPATAFALVHVLAKLPVGGQAT